jgi:translation initiation factor 3 subunit C
MYQSRHLKRLIEAMERSAFTGPAENSREALVLAARKLACAEWEACLQSILSVKAWEVGGLPLVGAVREMIEARIKEASLCTFVYSFGPSFDALLLSYLAESFEMEISSVSAVLSKVIAETGLPAVIDEQKGCLKWTVNVQLSKLQEMSMVLADKIQIILDRNEETSEFMHRPVVSSNKI